MKWDCVHCVSTFCHRNHRNVSNYFTSVLQFIYSILEMIHSKLFNFWNPPSELTISTLWTCGHAIYTRMTLVFRVYCFGSRKKNGNLFNSPPQTLAEPHWVTWDLLVPDSCLFLHKCQWIRTKNLSAPDFRWPTTCMCKTGSERYYHFPKQNAFWLSEL